MAVAAVGVAVVWIAVVVAVVTVGVIAVTIGSSTAPRSRSLVQNKQASTLLACFCFRCNLK